MPIHRRDFLRNTAAGAAVTLFAPSMFARSLAGDSGMSGRTLIVLQLAGGNDALNTFIPYADARYRSIRPSLAIPDAEILQVDSRLGFHPALAPLVPLWRSGRLAFVSGVGFDTLDRSHFHCQDVWQTAMADVAHGSTGGHGAMGWVGRWADLYSGHATDPLTTLAIGSRIPLGMHSAHTPIAVVSDEEATLRTPYGSTGVEAMSAVLESIYAGGHGEDLTAQIRGHGTDLFKVLDTIEALPDRAAADEYPASPLGDAFELVARILASGHRSRAIWINTGGFDTHSGQTGTHNQLLGDVAQSLAAFQNDLETRGLEDDVVVMGWSEFGRRAAENASAGTDHGKAGAVFLLGKPINGGIAYGEPADLSRLDDGDIPSTTDFRDVYWTLIRDFFDNDPEPVLGKRYQSLGFVRRSGGARRRAVR